MLYTFESTATLQTTLPQITDELLMAAIQVEDKAALDEIYKRHHATIRAVINRVLHNDQSVEDLLQEVFMEVWRMAPRYSSAKGKALGLTQAPNEPEPYFKVRIFKAANMPLPH